MVEYAIIRVNDQTCFIKSLHLDRKIALVTYSEANKQWAAEFLTDGPYSAKALMIIAKFVNKQNKIDSPEYALAA